jgi:hypothetical protein
MLKHNRKQVSRGGRPASFAKVWVYTDPTNTNLAQLFNENGTELPNPVVSGSEGWISFYTLERMPLYYTLSTDRGSSIDGSVLPIEGETLIGNTGANITAGQPVALVGGNLIPADSTNPNHCGKVVGLAYRSSLEGETAYVIKSGRIKNLGWSLGVDALFIASGYRIQNSIDPLNVFNQQIGVVMSADTVVVQLGEPTLC